MKWSNAMKVSNEFWTAEFVGCLTWHVVKSDGGMLAICNERTARDICDLHNAEIVQTKRGWTVKPVHAEDGSWTEWTTYIHCPCKGYHNRGQTPAAAILAANEWYEQNIEAEKPPCE